MPYRISIFEDELIVAMDIKARLNSDGHSCAILTSKDDLMEKIDEGKIEVLILDIKLKGGENGYEIAQEVRNKSEIPIIFITGTGSDEFKKRFLKDKNAIFLKKPISSAELNSAIKSIVSNN